MPDEELIAELMKDPTAAEVQRAREYLDRFMYTTTAVAALAKAAAQLCEQEEADEPWNKVLSTLVAAVKLVAEAEAEAL